MHLRRAEPVGAQQRPSPSPTSIKMRFESFMTLEQACSSEYQGAQGAFKDSMIH
jgi:hypothetical protein